MLDRIPDDDLWRVETPALNLFLRRHEMFYIVINPNGKDVFGQDFDKVVAKARALGMTGTMAGTMVDVSTNDKVNFAVDARGKVY